MDINLRLLRSGLMSIILMSNVFAQGFNIDFTAPAPVAVPTPAPVPVPTPAPIRSYYEPFLDSVEVLAKSLMPGRERLLVLKANINAENPEPKNEYEKQAVYDEHVANFEKAKQQKILKLNADLQVEEKGTMEKLGSIIDSKADFQPDWGGMLKFDANIEEYKARQEKFKSKITEMNTKINGINELLAILKFDNNSIEFLAKKNKRYISRLERACELMQDYIIQDRARVLTTEKKKTEMVLGSYDPEKEEFQTTLTDTISKTVPFDYSGVIKITPEQARAINRKTDDFTASVDYINYPFITGNTKLYLGVKKANIFYKDKEVSTKGTFKNLSKYETMEGYKLWAIYADSLLTGKLSPKKLDSLHAMSPFKVETDISSVDNVLNVANKSNESKDALPSKTFWTNKNIFQAVMFGLSAASLGAGFWHNREAASHTDTANQLLHEGKLKDRQNSVDDYYNSVRLRNGFWAGAGVFGLAGIVSFFF